MTHIYRAQQNNRLNLQRILHFNHSSKPFNRQIIQFETSTTSSEWKLFRFDKMEVNFFQILLVDVTFYI